jgi:hypothetical protein
MKGASVNRASGTRRSVSPLPPLALALCVAGVALVAALASGPAHAAGTKTLTLYSVATAAQYIDHSDDRERGTGKNPFATDTKSITPNDTGAGPFAGDDTIYGFTLYKDKNKTKEVGTASYTCHYNFAKHALCDAYFKMNASNLVASGPVVFSSTTFTLAITGGTNKYFAANGEVSETPVTKNEQRLDFQFLPA